MGIPAALHWDIYQAYLLFGICIHPKQLQGLPWATLQFVALHRHSTNAPEW